MLRTLSGVAFVDRLGDHGDAPALLDGSDTLSYAELDRRVDEVADRLGATRRLVLIEAANTAEAVVAYLGALRGNHPVILADGCRPQLLRELAQRFDPDVTIGADRWVERRVGTAHELHPDLAVLLSTSGSTGSPKLVRLSRSNIESNAEAIATYLELTSADRAITSLPLGYCYGLSVLHSHLAAGGSMVLTRSSVIDPEFWRLFRQHGATSFATVPHIVALLERSGLPWQECPSLRYVTQAGGRLAPAEVRRLHELGRSHGWQLFVMYGQTEATARMAYLPPSEAVRNPHCVGRPIPGGTLRIDAPGPDGAGELVYSGPNVMMGYATGPDELAAGASLDELRTGDIARLTAAGLVEIVGRTSRFAKLLGHRIDLERVQAALAVHWPSTVCTSDDHHLVVAVLAGADPQLVRRRVAGLTGLPAGLVTVAQYAEVPLLPNGKPDYQALKEFAAGATTGSAGGGATTGSAGLVESLQHAYAEVLGLDRVDPTACFVELGGDSLSFVEMADRLEEMLQDVPDNWPTTSIQELAAAASPTRDGSRSFVRLDTSVALRAVSIVLIMLAHLEIWGLRGGGHLLLALAGFTFARFPLAAVRRTDRVIGLVGSIARLAVPSMAFIAGLVLLVDGYSAANVVFLNHYLGPDVWGMTWNFWFVEALVEILLAALLLLSFPAVRRFERRHPPLLPALLLAAGLLMRYDLFGWSDVPLRYGRPHLIFWIFALGWLVATVRGPAQRLLASAVVMVAFTGYFPGEQGRELVIQAGMLLLIWLPSLPVPRLAAPSLRRVAAASLWIYLTHWVVWPFLLDDLRIPAGAVVVLCVVAGIGAAALAGRIQRLGSRQLLAGWRIRASRQSSTGLAVG